jgi:protein ImuA
MLALKKADIIAELQTDILRLQGLKYSRNATVDVGLGPLKDAFPDSTFPVGAVHEFLSTRPEDEAATSAFVAGLAGAFTGNNGTCLWISTARLLFPPALTLFGIQPDRCIFVDLKKEQHVLWAMEEALKCGAVSAVIGEMKDLSFIASRRLQLAVEQSNVTGFIIRRHCRAVGTTACVSRWKITTMSSESIDGLPGVGFPKWRVELVRIRNGRSGSWDISWIDGKFHHTGKFESEFTEQTKKAG